ncbi:MAG TPA: oxidoreductase [Verrucomicrobia bacterium]|nr:oxidoreductase [Verrucomicrobiota bacterium]
MKKINAVLVGCGGISNAWLGNKTVKEKVNIVGLVDLNPAAAEAKKERHALTGAAVGSDLEAMLKSTRPEVVFDCTIPEAHCATTVTALRHGCHVFGEKPMSDTMPNARKMLAAAQKADRIYAVMQNRRYNTEIRALRRFIATGAIGNLVAVHSDFFIGAHFGGFRDVMDHVLLLDMAIHSFDQARFLTGADATSVYSHEWTPKHSWYKSGPSAAAIFEMTGGLVYTYQGSWCAEGCPTPWECTWRLIGEKGTVLWDGAKQFRCEIVTGETGFTRQVKPKTVPRTFPKSHSQGHSSAIALFLESIRKGGVPETVCTDNIKSMAMVHGAVQSATTGKRVQLNA